MRIVIAPDSFKGSMSQVDVARVMARAIADVYPLATCVQRPMADGGDGMLACVVRAREDVHMHHIPVIGPCGKRRIAQIGLTDDGMAIIEIAQMVGIDLVQENMRNPAEMTTFGIGQAMRYVLDHGAKEIIIGLGGSATNDGGVGMLQALGATIEGEGIDSDRYLKGKHLSLIDRVDLSTIDQRLTYVTIRIASDVTNPLYGKEGATYIFGPQKGVSQETLATVDAHVARYAETIIDAHVSPSEVAHEEGAGAAGGLGFALLLLRGTIEQGAKVVADMIQLDEALKDADLVITGEGKTDDQTMRGKAPYYVASRGRYFGVRTMLLSGEIEPSEWMHTVFDEVYALVSNEVTETRAMQETETVLTEQIHTIFRRMYR